MSSLHAALEAGGTKFIAAVGRAGEPPLREVRIPTGMPRETLGAVVDFLKACRRDGLTFEALGIGCFGPIDPDPASAHFGHILATPKPGWAGTDVVGFLTGELGVPVGFDTDVNGAALAEARLGAGAGLDPVVYYTIGTGIGAGALVNGGLLHGRMHPEMGHARVARHPSDRYEGKCPFHRDCLEGLAAGPAIEARWGLRGEELEPGHPAWDMEAWYIAQAVVNTMMVLSPRKIILGGGVMAVPGLLARVHGHLPELCAGYLGGLDNAEAWAGVVTGPDLVNPGLTGAFLLAGMAAGH